MESNQEQDPEKLLIKCGDQQWTVSKNVLSANFQYFIALYASGWVKSGTGELVLPTADPE